MTITITDEALAGTLKSMEIDVKKRAKFSAMEAFIELLNCWYKRTQKSEDEAYAD